MTVIREFGQFLSSTGVLVGITVVGLLASLAMVQFRCKLFDGSPCGDWAAHGYTWHFWPPFGILLIAWLGAASAWARRSDKSLKESVRVHGEASTPMLGLVVGWSWYGLTGLQFHAPACTTPILCHDGLPHGIAYWTAPWIAAGAWKLFRLWRG